MEKKEVTIFWFRRDLRLNDNCGLFQALNENTNVLPIFIFDQDILSQLSPIDHRVTFIFDEISKIKTQLNNLGSDLIVEYGKPLDIFKKLRQLYSIQSVYTNHDYESYGQKRDSNIQNDLNENNIQFKSYKNHVIFEKSEILSDSEKNYTVYTPYKKKWLGRLSEKDLAPFNTVPLQKNYLQISKSSLLNLEQMGFKRSPIQYPELKLTKSILQGYEKNRDFPFLENGTSKLGLHLRFGTASVRYLAKIAKENSDVWLSELIWRDFFNQILFHFPKSETKSFRPEYENIKWRDDENDFVRWQQGLTGYPLVDAGMRELNSTGHMHNRVRMVTASFLTKHLLIHWKKGERYFASLLYDYDLSANVGNWQWAAGTGCDAAPYFRIFNPTAQQEKFDPDFKYIKKWVPEFGTKDYVAPMVEHTIARERCLSEYKKGLGK